MKGKSDKEITVKIFFNEEGEDINKILRSSVLFFLESEVKKLFGGAAYVS